MFAMPRCSRTTPVRAFYRESRLWNAGLLHDGPWFQVPLRSVTYGRGIIVLGLLGLDRE